LRLQLVPRARSRGGSRGGPGGRPFNENVGPHVTQTNFMIDTNLFLGNRTENLLCISRHFTCFLHVSGCILHKWRSIAAFFLF